MKLSKKKHCCDDIFSIEDWRCFDNCPVCRVMKKAIEEGSEISSNDLEAAFAEAEGEILDKGQA